MYLFNAFSEVGHFILTTYSSETPSGDATNIGCSGKTISPHFPNLILVCFSTSFRTLASKEEPRIIAAVLNSFAPNKLSIEVPSIVWQQITSYALEAVTREYLNSCHKGHSACNLVSNSACNNIYIQFAEFEKRICGNVFIASSIFQKRYN